MQDGARYRDESGVEHARHFTTKTEGQRPTSTYGIY